MASYTVDDAINKLRQLKLVYIENNIGSDPAALPQHFSEFLGYATLLYDHYAEYIKKYELAETRIVKEENEARAEHNKHHTKREDRITVGEIEQRIDVRIGTLKAEKKRLELSVKGATLHINGCQSLMKTWSDEAKGIR